MKEFVVKILKTKAGYYARLRRVIKISVNGEEIEYYRESCRTLFRYKNFIIKFDRGRTYKNRFITHDPADAQCLTEAELWETIKRKDRPFFAGILGSGQIYRNHRYYDYIIQYYIHNEGPTRLQLKRHPQKESFYKIIQKYGIEDVHSRRNIRVLRNRLKIVDFGMTTVNGAAWDLVNEE